jgi:TRAP-type C4-dicarboxylate transport system permease small subunit
MKQRVLRVMDAVYLACIWVAGTAIFFMSLIIPWGIFSRYVLGTGSQWPEPIAILLMVVFTFIGAAASYRAGSHIAVAMLTDRLPDGLKKSATVFSHLIMLLLSIFMTVYGVNLCIETWGQSISELSWMPVGLTYSPVPIGGFLTLLFVLEHMCFGSQSQRAIVRFDHDIDHAIEPATGAN